MPPTNDDPAANPVPGAPVEPTQAEEQTPMGETPVATTEEPVATPMGEPTPVATEEPVTPAEPAM